MLLGHSRPFPFSVEMAKTQYIVIVGCGRLGATLANRLSHLGHSVVVVDHAEARLSSTL
jgi:trk system potassium uptake protein TrkA